MTLSHIDQIGSIRTFVSCVWIRNDACPIQVMQICPGCTFGKSGCARVPKRLVKSEGIQTLVIKLRLVQSLPGRNFTRFDFFAPGCCAWRTILRFLEKGFGTGQRRYKRRGLNQTLTGHWK